MYSSSASASFFAEAALSVIGELICPPLGSSVIQLLVKIKTLCQEAKYAKLTCIMLEEKLSDVCSQLDQMARKGTITPQKNPHVIKYQHVLCDFTLFLESIRKKNPVARFFVRRQIINKLELIKSTIESLFHSLHMDTYEAVTRLKKQWEADQETMFRQMDDMRQGHQAMFDELSRCRQQLQSAVAELNERRGRSSTISRPEQCSDQVWELIQEITSYQEAEGNQIPGMRSALEQLLILVNGRTTAEPVIGIDLGTTTSCVSFVDSNGHVSVIGNDQGQRVIPSSVDFKRGWSDPLVGSRRTTWSKSTVFDVKRIIGRRYDDRLLQLVRKDLRHWPFALRKGRDGFVEVALPPPKTNSSNSREEKVFTPPAISSLVLKKLRDTAVTKMGCPVTKAVITVPAYFDDVQRKATKQAAELAGLDVIRIINEPTAAAVAYGLHKLNHSSRPKHLEKTILVYDFGGGTFDVSVVRLEMIESQQRFTVIATAGNPHLGGEDFDNMLVDYCLGKVSEKTGVSVTRKDRESNMNNLVKLRASCEQAKRELSSAMDAAVDVPRFGGIFRDETQVDLSRAEFEDLCAELFEKTVFCMEQCLRGAGLTAEDIDDYLLVGGTSRIPKVQELVRIFFGGRSPSRGLDPDEAIATGAAIFARELVHQAEEDAIGPNLVIEDVTSHSYGTECEADDISGRMSVILKKNSSIPACRFKTYVTTEDQQTSMIVQVYEGEDPFVENNLLLNRFVIQGIPPAPKGKGRVTVTFSVDEEGILKVTAESAGARKTLNITLANAQKDDGRL